MALDPLIEEIISTQIEGQFPLYYRDEGPIFVAFVETYYKWLESQDQALYHARRIPSYKDVDTTTDDFIVHFKQKFLNGIQLETESNVRQLIKHSLDLYRTKGSERSIDLLFRLVFGTGAKVYYPSKDIFRLSDGEWISPVYLEVVDRGDLMDLLGSQVEGTVSKARGFVERVVRKKTPFKYVNIVFLSGVKGIFQAGEVINRTSSPLVEKLAPVVAGSLSALEVAAGGGGYSVGDLVDVTSTTGYGAKARVTAVTTADGAVNLNLVDGGYGYTVNAQVLVSNSVLTLSGFTGGSGFYVNLFDTLVQKSASIQYQGANGVFQPGANVFTYNANNVVTGTAIVTASADSGSGNGQLLLSVMSGNVSGGPFYTTANAVSANQSLGGYSLSTATGNVIGANSVSLVISGKVGSFIDGETIYSAAASAVVSSISDGVLGVGNVNGRFVIANTVVGSISGATASVDSVSMKAGLTVSSGIFTAGPFAYAVLAGSVPIQVSTVSTGVGFQASLGGIDQTETVPVNVDLLATYANVALNSGAYGFPALPSSNSLTIISSSLTFTSYEIGRASVVHLVSAGLGYSVPPMIRIYEPYVYSASKRGYGVAVSGSGVFFVDEIVRQAATGARGQVISANSTSMVLKRMSLNSDFVPTSNSTTYLVGDESAAQANVVSIVTLAPQAMGLGRTGVNAVLDTFSSTEEGYVSGLAISDSGLGYVDGELVSFGSGDKTPGTASAFARTQGIGTGYYKKKGGFLSSNKKLFDGDYYQEFSYEVRSGLALDRYHDMLKQVLHVAGTKMFGALVTDSRLSVPVGASATVTVS